MAKRRMGIILFMVCFCLCLIPFNAKAASDCTLTVSCQSNGISFSGIPVKLYKIAELSGVDQYTLESDFVSSGIDVSDIHTSGGLNVIRSTLETYILSKGINADLETVTDHNGKARFEMLEPGLFFAVIEPVILDDLCYSFTSALVTLPAAGIEGPNKYNVEISPKPEIISPSEEEIQLKVLKLWKGDNGKVDRPDNIEVEIFRDGICYQTVLLSDDNNWSYSWITNNDGASWTVTEREVPSKYTMTVEKRGTSFILTNTRNADIIEGSPDAPKTGDTANLLLYIVLMFISGSMLIILGITGKRKRR